MLMRVDPFREFDRLVESAFGSPVRPYFGAMDAYRRGDEFVVHFDLPGVDPQSIDVTVERNQLTVTAERSWEPREDDVVVASERPQGRFQRQLFLGEGLDADRISASYDNGVLTVRIPVAEAAKPRRVAVTSGAGEAAAIETSGSESQN